MSLGNQVAAKLNDIEVFVQNLPGYLFPLKIIGWILLFVALMVTNFIAVIKWPFSALIKLLSNKKLHKEGPMNVATDSALRKVIAEHDTVLVDFWAEWCGPCLLMTKTIDNIANEHAGKLTVVKVDVSLNSSLAKTFAVRGLPTFIVFKAGKELVRKSGSLTKSQLSELIGNAYINHD